MPDKTPLVLKAALTLEGTRHERGAELGTIDAKGLIKPIDGVTRGQLVALRRRGRVNDGPLPDPEDAELEEEFEEEEEQEQGKEEPQVQDAQTQGKESEQAADPNAPIQLPDDFPGFKALAEAGITTFDGVRAVADLTALGGIGQPTAQRITEALSDDVENDHDGDEEEPANPETPETPDA